VREAVRVLLVELACVALTVMAISCGRSENVGWSERQAPGSVTTGAAERSPHTPSQTAPQELPLPESREAAQRQYTQLARTLSELQARAMQDEEIAAAWVLLNRDVEAQIMANSPFHRELAERRVEIEQRVTAADQSVELLSDRERAELAENYRNILSEFARVRALEFENTPRFAERLKVVRRATFDKMRELAPWRASEVDRLQEMLELLDSTRDTVPPVPGMRPPG
jgi:hypothetical protein